MVALLAMHGQAVQRRWGLWPAAARMRYIGCMPDQTREVLPGPDACSVRTVDGELLRVPMGWELLAPGDAGLTRRVKKAGPSWTVKEKKGRRTFSRGVWAPAEHIALARQTLDRERAEPSHARRLEAGRARRAAVQSSYASEFEVAVQHFLAFAPIHDELAVRLARAIASHSVPVGSGTVARTRRIPIEARAEAATIAWLRHATTAYDTMSIPRVKGMRREVRRMLAERSRDLLRRYRRGECVSAERCPLEQGLSPG